MKKIFNVVMLPTEKASLYLEPNGKGENILKQCIDTQLVSGTKQHLYIISNDEIKEGDWVIETLNKVVFQIKTFGNDYRDSTFKKIVATTDHLIIPEKSMFSSAVHFLPNIPESFIKTFVESNGTIKEVKLECYFTHETEGDKFLCIKTNPDNTVIVHQSKMYSEDDIYMAIEFGRSHSSMTDRDFINSLKQD